MEKAVCANTQFNQEQCTCQKSDCKNRGVCCDCLRTHLGRNTLPACVRKLAADQTAFRDYLRGLVGG